MEKLKIIEHIEQGAHHFLHSIKIEGAETKEAVLIVQKYVKEGKITADEEHMLKMQMIDSLKMIGVVVPFVLIPGASILMPIIIKIADKHNIELLPTAFNDHGTQENEVTIMIEKIESTKKP